MLWRPLAVSGTNPQAYRLQNFHLGTAKSLDTPLIEGVNRPGMRPTASVTGQNWYFTRQNKR
jgi:hypothetical protein